MTPRALLLLVPLAWGCDDDRDGFPINPGGGGSGGTFLPDAAIMGDASNELSARVCLLADPRQPTTCASSGADNLLVTLGSQQATTGADGSFTMMRPVGTNLVWSVTGTGIEPTTMRFGTATKIPALSTAIYGDMLAGMSAIVSVDTGAIILQLTDNGAPVTGVVAVPAPVPDSEIYYDGAGIADWNFDATGPFGVVWISSIAPGSASLSFDLGTTTYTVGGIPVVAGTLTFELAGIP